MSGGPVELPSDAKLARLPAWAQDYIAQLVQQRREAVDALNAHLDAQKPSKVYAEKFECTGEEQGPTLKRYYFQHDTVVVQHAGVELRIYATDNRDIRLQWGGPSLREVALIPESFQSVRLVAKDRMRS